MTPARIARVLGEYGAALGTLYLLHRAMGAVSGGRARIVPYALYAQPIGAGHYANVRDDAATIVAQADPGTADLGQYPRPAPILLARWQAGAECHVAHVRGQLAGTIWLARGRYEEDEVRCTYVLGAPARTVWDFDVYVEPRFRFGRTLARLWKAVDAKLAGEAVRWSVSRISRFNPASLRAHERLGARPLGWISIVAIGPLQWWVAGATRGPWRMGLGKPTIHLNPEAPIAMSLAPPSPKDG